MNFTSPSTLKLSILFLAFISACDNPGEPSDPPKTEEKIIKNNHQDTQDEQNEQPESCSPQEDSRACTTESGSEGIQYCDYMEDDSSRFWGPCLDELDCELGEAQGCGLCVTEGESDGEEETDGSCPFEGFGQSCILYEGVPVWECDVATGFEDCPCNTPLVFSFDRAPVQMIEAPTTTFDIDGNGACITTDWPTFVTPWLALDINKDGIIDSGRELFGSGTRLHQQQRAQNGFIALAEVDSNHDGYIDAMDDQFANLVLWFDLNSDKRGTFEELESLAMRNIIAINLSYTIHRVCDNRGNCGVERSSFDYIDDTGMITQGEVVDVHLACQ